MAASIHITELKPHEWERYKDELAELYEYMNTKQIVDYLRAKRHLKASPRVLRRLFQKWGLWKHLKDSDANAIVRIAQDKISKGQKVPRFELGKRSVSLGRAIQSLQRKTSRSRSQSRRSSLSASSDLKIIEDNDGVQDDTDTSGLALEQMVQARSHSTVPRTPSFAPEERCPQLLTNLLEGWYCQYKTLNVSPLDCSCCSLNGTQTPCRVELFGGVLNKLAFIHSMMRQQSLTQSVWSIFHQVARDLEPTLTNPGPWIIPQLLKFAALLTDFDLSCGPEVYKAIHLLRIHTIKYLMQKVHNMHPIIILLHKIFLHHIFRPDSHNTLVDHLFRHYIHHMESWPNPPEKDISVAVFGLTSFLVCRENYSEAATILSRVSERPCQSDPVWRCYALLHLARVYQQAERFAEAENACKAIIHHISDNPHDEDTRTGILVYMYARMAAIYHDTHQWLLCEGAAKLAISCHHHLDVRNQVIIFDVVDTLRRALLYQGKIDQAALVQGQWSQFYSA